MDFKKNFDKTIALLTEYCRGDKNRQWVINLIENSDFSFRSYYAVMGGRGGTVGDYYDIFLDVEPIVYLSYLNNLNDVSQTIQNDLARITNLNIEKVEIKANYERFQIINAKIHLVYTEWEEINSMQDKLLNLFKLGGDSIDFQNIGNTSRTLMQKLANNVFNPDKHIPSDSSTDVTGSKFKNQLRTYISCELEGSNNKELRKVAQSTIDLVLNSIDLMNRTTHKLDASKQFSELCVISAISTVSIIKTVSELKK